MTIDSFIKLYIKELIRNKIKILGVFFTIFLSLLIFSSVIVLRNNIENEVTNNSRTYLGGDLELSSKNYRLNLNEIETLKKNYKITEVIEFTSILKNSLEESKTVRIKLIDDSYPLIGNVVVEPYDALTKLKRTQNTILVNSATQKNLNIKLGDELKIQNISFKVIGIIKNLPDMGRFFVFGDYGIISNSNYDNLEMNNLGSFIEYLYKIVKKDYKTPIIKDFGNYKNFKVKFPEDISESLTKNIENFIFFLSLISVSALLISGIGLKNSLFSFLSSNQRKIAIFKSLGLSSKNIKSLYFLQMLIVLCISSLVAYTSSLLFISIFESSFLQTFDINLKPEFKMREYILILGFSLMIFFIFANPVFEIINTINVSDLFRNSTTNLNFKYSRMTIYKISILLILFIFCFCLSNVKPFQSIFFFIFFIVLTFFYYCLSKIQIKIIDNFKSINLISLKIAVKNLLTFQSLNSIVTITMGLGLTLLLFLASLSFNISKELSSSIKKNAPDYFFIGIQKNEVNLFLSILENIEKNSIQKIVPMISARIEKINNVEVKKMVNKDNESYWFINGERRISWSKDVPSNNQISKGKWWNSINNKNLMLSLDDKVARNLGLNIGDSITFNIYGKEVSGNIMNFRYVDYTDLNINFAILFNPEYGSKIPHEFMSTVKFKDKDTVSISEVLKKLPNLTYIDLSEYVVKTKIFLNKLFTAGILISSIVIFIGLFVISNAINVVGKLKIYQNLVFRILGFEESKMLSIIIFESIIIILPIILSSLIFSNLLSFVFIKFFFDINWSFSLSIFLVILAFFLFALFLTYLVSNKRFLNIKAYQLIKNE